jgi:hypothetical protein
MGSRCGAKAPRISPTIFPFVLTTSDRASTFSPWKLAENGRVLRFNMAISSLPPHRAGKSRVDRLNRRCLDQCDRAGRRCHYVTCFTSRSCNDPYDPPWDRLGSENANYTNWLQPLRRRSREKVHEISKKILRFLCRPPKGTIPEGIEVKRRHDRDAFHLTLIVKPGVFVISIEPNPRSPSSPSMFPSISHASRC